MLSRHDRRLLGGIEMQVLVALVWVMKGESDGDSHLLQTPLVFKAHNIEEL